MKQLILIMIVLGLMACSDTSNNESSATVNLESRKDSVSYSIGYDVGRSFNMQAVDIDADVFGQGFKDAFLKNESPLTETQMREISMSYQQEHREKQAELNQVKATENKKAGEEYLAENAKKEGVKTTDSGLQFKVILKGTGPVPNKTDKVKVHYTGKLLDDTVFDSSVDRGEPTVFGVNQVIRGWSEALQMMPVGSKWILYIPSNLAYGERGPNPTIGPNSTLIFEVDLLSIEEK